MTPRDPELFLHDMLDSAIFLQSVVEHKGLPDYQSDRLLRSAVQRELMIIGEALFSLNKLDPELAQRVPECQAIIAFRHILVHGYHQLDARVVWSVLTDKLSPLIGEVQAIITDMKTDP